MRIGGGREKNRPPTMHTPHVISERLGIVSGFGLPVPVGRIFDLAVLECRATYKHGARCRFSFSEPLW